jgi:hypothetical protein
MAVDAAAPDGALSTVTTEASSAPVPKPLASNKSPPWQWAPSASV